MLRPWRTGTLDGTREAGGEKRKDIVRRGDESARDVARTGRSGRRRGLKECQTEQDGTHNCSH